MSTRSISSYCAFLLSVASALAVCAQVPLGRELLNSERIAQKFGSYGIEVLSSDGELRVSRLYSSHGAQQVCRTFAVVAYPEVVDPRFAEVHAAILAGGSIGSTFTAAGWRVDKAHLYFGELTSSPRLVSLMGGIGPSELAVHVYALSVVKDGVSLDYASIVEVHHPDYLRLEDLEVIYGPITGRTDERVGRLLEQAAEAIR